jgi:ribonuclease D
LEKNVAMGSKYKLIESESALVEICDLFKGSLWLAIDTEFEREKTFYPELCLLQVANDDIVAIVDPLKIANLQPIFDLLYDPSITKVFHAARQDLEIFCNLQKAIPAPLFDTQIAAPLLGYDEQIGYANLVNKMLNVELSKAHTRTDWKQRPLQEAQLQYAADDVIYLGQIYELLVSKLKEHGRLDWLVDDFLVLLDTKLYEPDPETVWRKIRAAKKLKGPKLCALQHLAAWRENKAREQNRPRNWLMRDDVLVDLAQLQPKNLSDLDRIKAMSEGMLNRHGQEILKIIDVAKQHKPMALSKSQSLKPLNIKEEAIIDAMMAIVRLTAFNKSLHPNILASRKELEKFVRDDGDSLLHKGWRGQLVGFDLAAFLNGEISFQIEENEMVLIKKKN